MMNISEREADPEELEIHRLIDVVPVLQDKMIVDLVNGIEVTQDHIRVKEDRSKRIWSRMTDAFTGKSDARQRKIDQNLNEGLRTTMVWLEELQASQIQSDRALAYVTNKLSETRSGIVRLVDKHMEMKSEVQQLDEKLNDLEERFLQQNRHIHEKIHFMDMRQNAMVQMNTEFDKWAGGAYAQFSPLVQLFLVLENLNWGPFGIYDAINPEFRDSLYYKCSIILNDKHGIASERNLPTVQWMLPLMQERKSHKDMLRYLLQDEVDNLQILPIQGVILKTIELDPSDLESVKSIHNDGLVPHVLQTKRLSKRLMDESLIRMQRRGLYVS
ncbi:diguanylate cyclase regulator RdcB family protein [Paenibacillus azoreducens]|uniref:diguanylate cyclase regulator RdcB family protein n=1 Tax=Paenibacillus azoreducens TaxID=116718 RepID=UPI0039F5EDC8